MRIALLTSTGPQDADPDEIPLRDALRAAGATAEVRAWDDPTFNPRDFDLAVLRSTWNYYRSPDRFLEWCDAAARATRLLNPADVVRTNAHKRYLRDLERRTLPIVPTAWFDRGAAPDLAPLLRDRGWTDFVVKPAVSAGSWRTRRFSAAQARDASAFLATITADGDAMIQPFVPSVERGGEKSILWIAGEVTHTIIKHPRFAGHEERVELGPEPTPAEIDMVRAALGDLGDRLLYARLDVMLNAAGRPMVSELELIEPSLFLLEHPPAMERLVTAIAQVGRR